MTRANPATMRRLERLQRLRDIGRVQAMRDAAGALGDLARAEAVARRSAALKHPVNAARSGEELREDLTFASALTNLRDEAQRSAGMARDAANAAQSTLTKRSRERDLVQDKLAQAQRAANRPKLEASPALARSLKSEGGNANAPHRQERHGA